MHNPQLFCFTYAGGNASFFELIERDLPSIEVVKLEYAGHGQRHRENFYHDFHELAEDIFSLLKTYYTGGKYALFGYSMGTISLVEILKRILSDRNMRKPECVFLAAHEPHTKEELTGYTDCESEEWIKERTIRFGAVPERLMNNKSFWRMYLPLYRADYSIIGKYRFEDLRLQTKIPATVFYSESDTPKKDMELWKRYFTGDFDLHQYQGTHFFIREHHMEIAEIISWKIQKGGIYE